MDVNILALRRYNDLVLSLLCFPASNQPTLISLSLKVVTAFSFLLSSSCSSIRSIDHGGMIFIKGGEFLMGTNTGYPYEGPSHRVVIDSFYLDATEVTNQQFSEFSEATGYITESERQGSSGVFDPKTGEWNLVTEANWRHPEGPSSNLKERDLHPVIHISWNDAVAFSSWAGKRLPTEAEWEYAASGMGSKPQYPWGDKLMSKNQHVANWWQGVFPTYDLKEDGFSTVAPVKQFPATGDGLYDMGGNVWEWVADWYDPTYYHSAPTRNPTGPAKGNEKVHRGGSWMCSRNYCRGFRVAARQKTSPGTGLNNLGFRCAAD